MSEIHKNRGNRRRRDRLKRKHKFNLAKSLFDAFNEVLGKYDKGHVYDLNKKKEDYDDYYQDGTSRADKRKIESCNEKLKDYETGKDEIDAMVVADIKSYYEKNNGHFKRDFLRI